MIEKLDRKLRHEKDSGFNISEPVSIGEMQEKINELVDAVNVLQLAKDAMFYAIRDIQNATKNTNISKMENVPGPIKLYVCADGSVYDNEDVAKNHAAGLPRQWH